MESGQLYISVRTANFLIVIIFYIALASFFYRRLFRRLSLPARWMAGFMLVAQVMVILVSLEVQNRSSNPSTGLLHLNLWHLDKEGNFQTVLASAQLSVVSGVALMTAWLASTRPALQRLYLVAIGLLFLYLAWDEYVTIHEFMRNWKIYYAVLGAAVVAVTTVMAIRSPRHYRIWHFCLLAGLAMSAFGAIVVNTLDPQTICGRQGMFFFDGCFKLYHFEEILEFSGIWLALVAVLGQFSDAVRAPKRRVGLALFSLPLLWVFLLIHDSIVPTYEYVFGARPATVRFESGVELRGLRIDYGDEAAFVELYASASAQDFEGGGYSVHLVEQATEESVAGRDVLMDQHGRLLPLGIRQWRLYRQRIEVEIPPQTPGNRAFWIVLTHWRRVGDVFVPQAVHDSDYELLSDTQVVLSELVIPATTSNAAAGSLAGFDNGFTLEAAEMPESVRSGETLTITFAWRSDVDGSEDHVQFLHLGHEESGEWWVYDQQPLGARLPTRLWYEGLTDSEIWQVPLPQDLAPGQYIVFTGLYRTRDLERVPTHDREGTYWLDARVPLGIIRIE